MELLIVILNQPEYLNDILEGFLYEGISGATVIETTGMGRTLCDKVPIFGGIRSIIQGCRPNNLTIFTVLRSEDKRNKAIKVIEEHLGDISKPNTGFYFTVPVSMARGFAEPLG
jgi:nitrogen regulatory protein PII